MGAVVLTAGCNSSAKDGVEPDRIPESAATSGSAASGTDETNYPLTLKTPYGTSVLKSQPRRVAIAGQVGDSENVISLGVIPVIAPKFQLQWPWIDADVRSKIKNQFESGADSEVPMEELAAAHPDVIIATSDTKLADHYQKLSKIAPVVAFPDKAASTQFDWQQSIKLLGKALNRNAEAEEQITRTKDLIAKAESDHPEFDGTSISFTIDYGEGNGMTFYNGSGSPGEEFLQQLGFAAADNADKFAGERPQVSQEQLPLLDSDVVVVNYNTGAAEKEKVEANRIFQNIPAVKDGRYLGLLPQGGTSPVAWSMARPTAINLQWSINYLVPKLAPVAKKAK
jgi:iron complex transport system substrate-binding protein